jgi:drug/metabolite transporter (DMT)-like permease
MTATATTIAPSDQRRATLLGIGLMLLGVCVFSIGDLFGKMMVATLPVGQFLMLRAGTSLALLSPVAWRERASFPRMSHPWLQLWRVILSASEVAAFFFAAIYLPLADIITYYLASPIFVTVIAAIVLKEPVDLRRWAAVGAGFVGVLLALKPGAGTVSWPALVALAGSFAFAILMVVTRFLRGTPDIVLGATQISGTFCLGLALILPLGWSPPGLWEIAVIVLGGCITVVALFSVNRSLKLAPASVVVPYQYSMIIWAVIFGYLGFGDVPAWHTLGGAAIIIASGLYIFMREQAAGHAEPVMDPPPA